MSEKVGGFIDWKLGQEPNTLLMFIGYCCCCGLPLIAQMHAFRNELKAAFSEVDDNLHWVNVIISIYGLYQNEQQLGELEKQHNVTAPAAAMPWWLPIVIPILWPMAIAAQMKRLNALASAVKQ